MSRPLPVALALLFGASLSTHSAELERGFIPALSHEESVLTVTIDYRLNGGQPRSVSQRFREDWTRGPSTEPLSGPGSIACGVKGFTATLDSSFRFEDAGIRVSLTISKTEPDAPPQRYRGDFLIPWNRLTHDASSRDHRVLARVEWKREPGQAPAPRDTLPLPAGFVDLRPAP